MTPKRMKRYHDKMQFLDKFSAQSLVIHILLDAIAPEHGWNKKLKGLFHEHPSIKLSDMGF